MDLCVSKILFIHSSPRHKLSPLACAGSQLGSGDRAFGALRPELHLEECLLLDLRLCSLWGRQGPRG